MVKVLLRDDSSGADSAQLGVVCGLWLAGPWLALGFAVIVGGAGAVSLFLLVVFADEILEDCCDKEENTANVLVEGFDKGIVIDLRSTNGGTEDRFF